MADRIEPSEVANQLARMIHPAGSLALLLQGVAERDESKQAAMAVRLHLDAAKKAAGDLHWALVGDRVERERRDG